MKEYLRNLRQNAEQRRVPIMSPQTEAFIAQQLLEHKPMCCVEIGSAI